MNYDVYGVGNALVDTEYKVDDAFLEQAKLPKGLMTLIEEEERQKLTHLLERDHGYQAVKRTGGGSAANSVALVSCLGGSVFYSCKVAGDPTGDFFAQELVATGIDNNLGDKRDPGTTGHCISMVTPDAERTMATCLGITNFLSPEELDPDALKASSILYIEGYLVSSTSGFQAACEAQEIARAAGVTVALTLSDPTMIEHYRGNHERLLDSGVDLLFCNYKEAKLLTGADTVSGCVSAMKKAVPAFVMTCGKHGSIAFDGKNVTEADAVPANVVDTTGAGDVFAGAFLFCLARNLDFKTASELANKAASLVISRFGARLEQDEVTASLAGEFPAHP